MGKRSKKRRSGPAPTPDKYGRPRIRRGGKLRINYEALARELRPDFDVPSKPRKPRSKKKIAEYKKATSQYKTQLSRKAIYRYKQAKAGKVGRKLGSRNIQKLARIFPDVAPEGSKRAYLPKKYAAKKLIMTGNRIIFRGANIQTEIFPITFFTEEFAQTLDDLLDAGAPDLDLLEIIEPPVKRFLKKLPKGTYTLVLATGDYSGGSEEDKESMEETLGEMILAFIKSKSPWELDGFIVGVGVNTPAPRRKKKRAK